MTQRKTDLNYLLDTWGFSMVEFTVLPEAEPAPADSADRGAGTRLFGADWKAEVLIEGAWLPSIPKLKHVPAVPRRTARRFTPDGTASLPA